MPLRTRAIGAAVLASMVFPGSGYADCLNFSSSMRAGATQPGVYETNQGYTLVVTLEEFYDGAGTPVVGPAGMEKVDCHGMADAFRLNNRSMRVTIAGGAPVEVANFVFCDFGGSENASASFATPHHYAGDLVSAPPPFVLDTGGNQVATDVTGGQSATMSAFEGKLGFRGEKLETILIGGQELFVTSVCVN